MAPTQNIPAAASAQDQLAVKMMHLLNTRALLPVPKGESAEWTLDSPNQVWFLVIAICCIAIPGLFMMVRAYTKLAIVKSFEIADYFICLAFCLIIVEVGIGYNAVKWGAGVHQWHITNGQLFEQLYWLNAGEITYCPLSFVVKMAVLLQYLRLFAPDRKSAKVMWYGSWITIAACFIFYVVLTFWTAFYCYPRQMIWNKLTPGGKCHDHSPIVMSQGTFNMISDVIILLLPTYSLWKLNVPRARKIVITALFATGLLAIAASAMRIVFTAKIEDTFRKADVSHNAFYIGLWTMVEVSLGLVVACSLSLPRLIQAKGQKLKKAVASPFSSLRSATGNTPKGSLASHTGKNARLSATMERSLGQQPMPRQDMRALQVLPQNNGKQPVANEQAQFHEAQQQRLLNPIQEDLNDRSCQPTPGGASSRYSSKRNSMDDIERGMGVGVAPFNISHRPDRVSQFPSGRRQSIHQAEYAATQEPWNSDPWSVDTTDLRNMPSRQNSIPPRKPLAPTSAVDARISRWPSKLDKHRSVYSLAPDPDSTSLSEHYTTPTLPQTTFIPPMRYMPTPDTHISHWPSNAQQPETQYHPPPPFAAKQSTSEPQYEPTPLIEPPAIPPHSPLRLHFALATPPATALEKCSPTPSSNYGSPEMESHSSPQPHSLPAYDETGGEILLARSYSRQKRRLTNEKMTIEQIEQEMNSLQQFRFEEVKKSLDSAVRGAHGYHA
ncbi:hypothetical protein K504DRAFT_502142 [Pleomassaria siparia CBS 279.74]|uniref:Rhodopsin domain-containing protein n=1 Tax=Pleomassaria siparia CBS 279.74 TaxID=1314801 RepID=A0A6G1K9C7_9PLEO|nr:hypothetical protein K504DRAFT_502142 [Pleomassaria siparia CBS 279.74]